MLLGVYPNSGMTLSIVARWSLRNPRGSLLSINPSTGQIAGMTTSDGEIVNGRLFSSALRLAFLHNIFSGCRAAYSRLYANFHGILVWRRVLAYLFILAILAARVCTSHRFAQGPCPLRGTSIEQSKHLAILASLVTSLEAELQPRLTYQVSRVHLGPCRDSTVQPHSVVTSSSGEPSYAKLSSRRSLEA